MKLAPLLLALAFPLALATPVPDSDVGPRSAHCARGHDTRADIDERRPRQGCFLAYFRSRQGCFDICKKYGYDAVYKITLHHCCCQDLLVRRDGEE